MKHLIVISVMIMSVAALADKVYVEKIGKNSLIEVDAATIHQLIVTALSSQGHSIASDPIQADYQLQPNIIQFGSSYLLAIEKTKNGKVLFSTKLKGKEVEELDDLSSRVVRAVTRNIDALKDAQINDVTMNETLKRDLRRPNRSGTFVGAGPGFLGGLGVTGPAFYFGLGRGWAMGPLSIGPETNLTFDFASTARMAFIWDLALALNYYPMETDIAPYFGAEFGYGIVRAATVESTAGGMMMAGTAGVGLFRTYGIHAQIGARFGAMLGTRFADTPIFGALRVGASF